MDDNEPIFIDNQTLKKKQEEQKMMKDPSLPYNDPRLTEIGNYFLKEWIPDIIVQEELENTGFTANQLATISIMIETAFRIYHDKFSDPQDN